MIVYRQRGLRIAELWFSSDVPKGKADIAFCAQCPEPGPGKCTETHTLIVDLTASIDDLFAQFKRDTRNEVRRSRDKDLTTTVGLTPRDAETVEKFCDFYDEFAGQKGLSPAPRLKLKEWAAIGALHLTKALDTEGEELVWHAYVLIKDRARLLYSASLFRDSDDNQRRNLIGRANRLLHLEDMQRLKEAGYLTYDLGGWYAGDTDEAKLRINKFKEEFGGKPVREYNCEVALSPLGKLGLMLYNRKKQPSEGE